ncbi:MAG: DUF1587 domain-containing protein, partial [Planctomycetaceae bacterium]
MTRSIVYALFLLTVFRGPRFAAADEAAQAGFETHIRPLLKKYCERCHRGDKPKGEFDLTEFQSLAALKKSRSTWRTVLEVLREDEMPPEEPLPTQAERETLIAWVDAATKIDWSRVRNPGHVTIPRLTRDEYNNTLRDLLGVDLRPGDTFTQDGEGQSGFTTDRDSLFVTPSLMQKYFLAAERALDSLIAIRKSPMVVHLESEEMFMTETKEVPRDFGDDFIGYVINRGQMTLYESVQFPADGWYEFRVRARSTAGPTGSRLRINDVIQGDIYVPSTGPETCTLKVFVRQGTHQVAWNIERKVQPPAELLTQIEQARAAARLATEQAGKAAERQSPQTYRKLAGNANTVVTQNAQKNYPQFPATGTEQGRVKTLITQLDTAAYSLQRPYEWLRLLKTDGDPNEIVRFKGYIADRTKAFDQARNQLAQALGQTRKQFDRIYAAVNADRLADNRLLLDRVQDVKPVPKRQPAGKTAATQKPGSVAIDWVEVQGPLLPEEAAEQPLVFIRTPRDDSQKLTAAREIIRRFAERA